MDGLKPLSSSPLVAVIEALNLAQVNQVPLIRLSHVDKLAFDVNCVGLAGRALCTAWRVYGDRPIELPRRLGGRSRGTAWKI